MRRSIFALFVLIAMCGIAPPVTAQANNVLVVYNAGVPDSQTVANYYATKRAIPVTNLCGISVSDSSVIGYPEYTTQSPLPATLPVRTQIRNCLTAVTTPTNPILYIVMSYMTPFDLYVTDTYALDSFIADIWDRYTTQIPTVSGGGPSSAPQGYYADAQNQGLVYFPFVPFATWRAQPRSTLIYSVWRLDGASLALAEGLVDKAIAAEQNGLTGQACFDLQFGNPDTANTPDLGVQSGDWDLHRAAGFLSGAGLTVTEEFNEQFEPPVSPPNPPNGPAPVQCNGAAFYAGWYSLNNYPSNTFTWNTGAIGFHIDSDSAMSPRGGTNWAANAIIGGITVTSGSVNEPFLQGLPRAGGLYRNLLQGASVGDAFMRNTRWLKWMVLNIGDPLYKPFPGGHNPPPAALSLSISPRDGVVGGYRSPTGTITLPYVAPPGGQVVSLSSPQSPVVAPPSSVTVPPGASQVSFTMTTSLSSGFAAFVDANTTGMTGTLTVRNSVSTTSILAFPALSQSTVHGGQLVGGTVFLNDRAPFGGIAISFSSSNPSVASVPSTVTVPAGQVSANFTVTTSPVGSSTPVTITASRDLVSPTVNLTVIP